MVAKKRGQDTPRDYHTRVPGYKGGSFVFVYTFRIQVSYSKWNWPKLSNQGFQWAEDGFWWKVWSILKLHKLTNHGQKRHKRLCLELVLVQFISSWQLKWAFIRFCGGGTGRSKLHKRGSFYMTPSSVCSGGTLLSTLLNPLLSHSQTSTVQILYE